MSKMLDLHLGHGRLSRIDTFRGGRVCFPQASCMAISAINCPKHVRIRQINKLHHDKMADGTLTSARRDE